MEFGKCGSLIKAKTIKLVIESDDGIHWTRNDNFSSILSSDNSESDSEMIEYAAVIKYKEMYYMFYNGNNYEIDGIGLAIGK